MGLTDFAQMAVWADLFVRQRTGIHFGDACLGSISVRRDEEPRPASFQQVVSLGVGVI